MKIFYLFICLLLVFSGSFLPVHSQDANPRKFNPDRPFFFSPKSHDPNFLKSGKISEKSFYQRKSEWKHIIDTTWGQGSPLTEKLMIFNNYAQENHGHCDTLSTLKLN